MKISWARLAAVGVASFAVVTALAAPAQAGTPAAVTCTAGYLCLVPASGAPEVLVPGGNSVDFSPALPISAISNQTKTGYCVAATASFGIAAGQSRVLSADVLGVEPGTVCPV